MNTTFRRASLTASCAGALVISAACGNSERQRAESPDEYESGTYSEQMSNELAEERQEFIQDKEQRLSEVDNRVQQLQSRLRHEQAYVPASEMMEWEAELGELQQESDTLKTELARARSASPAEWKDMRGPIALQTDRIEAALETTGSRLKELFSARDEREPVRGEDGSQSDREIDSAEDAPGPHDNTGAPGTSQPRADDSLEGNQP